MNTPARRKFLIQSGSSATLATLGGLSSFSAQATHRDDLKPTAPLRPDPAGNRPYNILFILTDQERYFDKWPVPLPGREAIARRGVTFTNHQIAACICSPSRSVIYTGQHIQQTGVFDNAGAPWQADMSPEIPTLGKMMQDAGYHSAYFGKWHLSKTMHRTSTAETAPVDAYNKAMRAYGFDDYFGVGDLIGFARGGYEFDGSTTASAIAWMKERGAMLNKHGKPWFLAVNLVNPHDVMFTDTDPEDTTLQRQSANFLKIARPPNHRIYRRSWPNEPLPPTRRQPFDEAGRPQAHGLYSQSHGKFVGNFPFTDERVRVYQDNYLNCIRDSDTHIVRLLDTLNALELDAETVVVLTSDHGELGGSHQMVDKGAATYREQNHVPLIIAHPRYAGNRKCHALTSHLDLAPTLLDLTRSGNQGPPLAPHQSLKGRSFLHLLDAPESAAIDAIRNVALFNYAMLNYADPSWLVSTRKIMRDKNRPVAERRAILDGMQPNLALRSAIRSVYDGRYRFSRYFAIGRFNTPRTIEELFADNDVELYDLANDRHETRNLALNPRKHGDLIAMLNRSLNEIVAAEVGPDDARSLPIENGKLIYHFGA